MDIAKGTLKREGYDISKEDLAKELEAQADRIRNGTTDALSVTIVAKDANNTVVVQNMFAATNPHRHDPESGHFVRAEITGLQGDDLAAVFDLYLNSIDVSFSDEGAWCQTDTTMGIGYLGGDGDRFLNFGSAEESE